MAGVIFWISFILIAQYIVLNLFILVVIQQFEEYHLAKDNPVEEFKLKFEKHFAPLWAKFTLRHGATKIHENQLVDFFCALEEPLGFKPKIKTEKANRTIAAKEIVKMELVSYFISI